MCVLAVQFAIMGQAACHVCTVWCVEGKSPHGAGSKAYYLRCLYCQWNTREVDIPDGTSRTKGCYELDAVCVCGRMQPSS